MSVEEFYLWLEWIKLRNKKGAGGSNRERRSLR
jgi:hypothetical protein